MASIFTILLMIAFAVYVLWDARRTGNPFKLLFVIPIVMSIFLFPPFIEVFSETGFLIYRTALILICFAIAVIYIVDQRKRQTALAKKREEEERARKKAAKKKK